MPGLGDINIAEPYDSDQESSVAGQIRDFKEDVKVSMQLEHADDGKHAGITLFNQKAQSTSTTISTDDQGKLFICANSGDITLELPLSSTVSSGGYFVFRKTAAADTITLAISSGSANTIDGKSSYVISRKNTTIMVVSDGADGWTTIDLSAQSEFRIYKETQQDISDLETWTEDDELKFSVGTNEKWSFELNIYWSGNDNLKIGWTTPVGLNRFFWHAEYAPRAVTNVVPYFCNVSETLLYNSQFAMYSPNVGGSDGWIRIQGIIHSGNTAGDVIFLWYIDSAVSNTINIYPGSTLIVKHLA